jgi:hypothetical protein
VDRKVVLDFAREVLQEVRPDEVDVFDSTADAQLDHPERAQSVQPNGGPLAADLGTMMIELTPAILWVTKLVIEAFATAAGDDLGKRSIGRLFRHKPAGDSESAPATPAAQITTINIIVASAADTFTLSAADSQAIAASVTGVARRLGLMLPAASTVGEDAAVANADDRDSADGEDEAVVGVDAGDGDQDG